MEKLSKQLSLFENKTALRVTGDFLLVFINNIQFDFYKKAEKYQLLFKVENMHIDIVFDKATVYPDYIILSNNSAMVAQIKTVSINEADKKLNLTAVSDSLSCNGCKHHNTLYDDICETCGDAYKNKTN